MCGSAAGSAAAGGGVAATLDAATGPAVAGCPPPVSFSPPNAPPISAPDGPMLASRWEHEAVLETVQARLDHHPTNSSRVHALKDEPGVRAGREPIADFPKNCPASVIFSVGAPDDHSGQYGCHTGAGPCKAIFKPRRSSMKRGPQSADKWHAKLPTDPSGYSMKCLPITTPTLRGTSEA
jgi:hypothetical protein